MHMNPGDRRVSLAVRHHRYAPRHSGLQGQDGLTVVELLVAAAILLTIAALAVPNLLAAVKRAKIAKAVADIHSIGTDIQAYQLSKGVFPNTLADIGYDKFNDPWHNPYQYLNFATVKGKGKMRKDRFLVPI